MFLKWTIRIAIVLLLIGLALFIAIVAKNKLFGEDTPAVTVRHNTTLEQIEAIGKLELTKYKFKDVLEYVVRKPWYTSDSKAIIIVSGEAVGCIDLSKIKPEHIVQKDSNTVLIQLPAPELCYAKVNHEESRLYNIDTGLFSSGEGKIVSEAYKEAEVLIQKVALESNILEQTNKNAELLLKPLLQEITKKKIVFTNDISGVRIERETRKVEK